MISGLVLLCWMLVGHAAATHGVPPDQRHIAWRIVGLFFGPLWIFVRADQARRPSPAVPSRSEVVAERIAA